MNWLATFATVNARTVVGLLESVGYVIYLAVGIWLHRFTAAEFEMLLLLGSFIGVHEGINLKAFDIKRKTFLPEAHETPPREDVQPPKPDAEP